MKDKLNRGIFFVLLTLSMVSVVCVFPYVMTIQGDLIRATGIPVGVLLAAQLVQCLVLFSIAIASGIYFTRKIGFGFPLIEAILKKEDYRPVLKNILGISIAAGIAAAVAIYVLDTLFTSQGVAISTHQNLAPVWQKLLAATYGGVAEEIIMRLFVMTLFIWISIKLFRHKQPTTAGIVVSIVLAAVIFGLGHLPITASITKLDAMTIWRAVVLNGIGGIVFGILFWKKGFESAMIAHFTADIFLLTLLPLVFT